MKKYFALIVFITTIIISKPTISQVTEGKTAYQKDHGNWSSFVVYSNKEARSRAMVMSSDGSLSLTVDAFQPDCKLGIAFILPYGKALDSNLDRKILITSRVDSKDVHYLNSDYNGVMGDTMAVISINPTPNFYQIITEFKTGITVRVRLEHTNGDQIKTTSFPLNGFTAALDRILSICEKANAPQENRSPLPRNETLPRHPDAMKL